MVGVRPTPYLATRLATRAHVSGWTALSVCNASKDKTQCIRTYVPQAWMEGSQALSNGTGCPVRNVLLRTRPSNKSNPPTICKLQSSSTSSSSGPPYGQCTASGACREPTFQPTGVLPEAQDRDWQRVQATQMCRLYMQQQSHSTPSLTLTHTLSTLLRTDLSGNGFSSRVVQRFIFIFFFIFSPKFASTSHGCGRTPFF